MQGDKPRCALYCRVARDNDDAPGEAIEQQRQSMLAYAQEMGYTVIDSYLDNGFSGISADRPAYKRLNADIQAGLVTVVITKSPSRLWRDYARCSEWLARMDRRGVTVLCRDAPEFQKQFVNLHTEFEQLYKRKRKKPERHHVRTPPPQEKTR